MNAYTSLCFDFLHCPLGVLLGILVASVFDNGLVLHQ